MTKLMMTLVASAALVSTSAFAGEMADTCSARLEADGRDTAGCTCLEDAVMADAALAEEFTELGQIADPAERFASASAEAQETMKACFPDRS